MAEITEEHQKAREEVQESMRKAIEEGLEKGLTLEEIRTAMHKDLDESYAQYKSENKAIN